MTVGGELAPHGTPDWQPIRAVADTELFSVANQAANPDSTHGPHFVGNFRAVGITLNTDSGRVLLKAEFFQDQALTVNIGTHQIRSDPGSLFNGSIAVLGPYLRITVSDETGLGSQYDLGVRLHQHLGMKQTSPTANMLIAYMGQSVAAAATRTDQAALVWPGPASLFMSSAATLGLMRLEFLTLTGTWQIFFQVAPTVLVLPVPIYLPAAPVRSRVNNSDAGARDFSVALLADAHLIRD